MDLKRDIRDKASRIDTGEMLVGDGASRKAYTHVDHDPKIRLATSMDPVDVNWSESYRAELQERVLSQSATMCPLPFYDFAIREGVPEIVWNEAMIKDEGFELSRLRDLAILLENRASLTYLIH